MIKSKFGAKEVQECLDEGYSFRFNSFVEEDVIHVMSEEQLEQHRKVFTFKIATVAYKHRYLCYLMEYGWEEGLDKCMEFANDQIDVFVYKEMLKLGYGYTYTREEAKEIDNKQYKAW